MKGRMQSIDFLRGIAILMVILVHSSQKIVGMPEIIYRITSWGETGCQLFFVLSGYLLTYSWRQKQRSIKDFYWSRWLSIGPAFYFAIIFWVTVGYIQYFIDYSQGFPVNGSAGAIAANILLLNGLFVDANNNVVPGGWFIGALVILYLMYPLLNKIILFLYNRTKVLLAGFVLLLYGLSKGAFGIYSCGYLKSIVLNAYSFIHQLSCFAMGIILCYFVLEYEEQLTGKKKEIAIFTLGLLFLQVYAFYHLPIPERNLISSVSFCGICLLTHLYDDQKKNALGYQIADIGKVSYEIYFIHFIFVWYLMPIGQKYILMISDDCVWQVIYYLFSLCVSTLIVYKPAFYYHGFLAKIREKLPVHGR